jgi:sugar O-acyltransferase (sialic acid O-acetyltransferase NeuD family)
MGPQKVAVYGGGGFAREVAWLVESVEDPRAEVVCFIDDNIDRTGLKLNDIPIMSLEDAKSSYPDAKVVGGIGSPEVREKVMDKAKAIGFDFFAAIHPNVARSKWIEIGAGVVICAGNILTTNIQIQDHVQINLDCTIGHDVVIEEYATLAPGVHVSGNVHILRGAYIGTGANIINGTAGSPIIIGESSVVGAGACVTKDVPPGATVVGIPAKVINKG